MATEKNNGIPASETLPEMSRNMAQVFQDFESQVALKLKPRSVMTYRQVWTRFVRRANIQKQSDLKGTAGRIAIVNYLSHDVKQFSRRSQMAILHTIFEIALPEIAWPITRKFMGKLPATRRRETPPDALVKQWNDCMKIVQSKYMRVIWVMIGAHGLRPSQMANLTWRNIVVDQSGNAVRIAASGAENDDKSFSDINAVISPAESVIMTDWRNRAIAENSEINDMFVVPASSIINPENINWSLPTDDNRVRRLFEKFQRGFTLSKLTPVDLRHWVASTLVGLGLSDPAAAAYQGHKVVLEDSQGNQRMRTWYNNPTLEKVIAEQKTIMPGGVMNVFDNENPRTAEFTDVEIEMFRDLKAGRIDSLNFVLNWAKRIQPVVPVISADMLTK